MKKAHALDPSTQRNDDTELLYTRKNLAPSAPSTSSRIGSCAPPGTSGSRAPPGTSGSGFSGLTGSDLAGNHPILNLQTVASHQSCFLLVHVDVVHVVFFVRNCATSVLRISQLLLNPSIASHEIFHLFDGAHEFRQLCSRRRQNLPQETSCPSRCVRVPSSVQLAPTLEAMVHLLMT